MTLQQLAPGEGTIPLSTRETTIRRLLDDDRAARRAAFDEAVSRRWIDRGGQTVVRAVILDEGADESRRVAFGRQVAASAPAPTYLTRERDTTLYFVTREVAAAAELDAWIQTEALRLGIRVLAIGSAHHDPTFDDLGEAAQRARVAADLSRALPDLSTNNSIDELGGWVLLHGVSAGSRRLADISPAADVLCRASDRLQRETIETYLDAGGQARVACERLHIHRTTLYYRLENMPEIVRDALDDGMKRSTLHLALKLIRLWQATGAL